MFIERAKEDEIPKDAIRLSSEEVYEYMINLIEKWPSKRELWAIKYGNAILSSAVVISNTFILNYYRHRLKIRNYGRFTLFLPVVLIPSIFDQIYQNNKTTKSVILQDDCSTCITTQSMFIQLGTGIVYPLMGSIGGSYIFATKMGTYFLGNSTTNIIKEFAVHLMQTSRPFYNRLAVFSIGHILLSYAVTYYQMENFEFLKATMLEQHKNEVQVQNSRLKRNKLLTS